MTIIQVIFSGCTLALFVCFHPLVTAPSSIIHLLAFLISAFFGYVCMFSISLITGLLSFVITGYWGLYYLKKSIVDLLSGALIPLGLLPFVLQNIAVCLPFKNIIYTPTMIYMGKFSVNQIGNQLIIQMIWAFILWMIAVVVYRIMIRRVTIMGVKYYLKLWLIFLSCNLQSKLSHKVDFIIGVMATLFMQGCSFIFLWVIFSQINVLSGWSLYEIAILYAYISIANGLEEIFLNGTWELPGVYIKRGELDCLLTRPVNPLFLIVANCMELHGLGSLLFGIVLMIYSLIQLGISLSLIKIVFLIISIVSSTVIFFSINLITGTLSFWVIDSMPVMVMTQKLNQLGQYPITIYNKTIKFLLSWIVPFAFVSYFPASFILNKNMFGIYSPLFAIIFFSIAYHFFRISLRKYESAGG